MMMRERTCRVVARSIIDGFVLPTEETDALEETNELIALHRVSSLASFGR
jgi:hypothetical protein